MKIRSILFLVTLLVIVTLNSVLAVPAAPSPTCKITGEITKIVFNEAYFQEDDGKPCNARGRNVSASYYLTLKIKKVATVTEDGLSCEELYSINSITEVNAAKNAKQNLEFKEGETIEGTANFSGDECSGGTLLWDYKIIDESSDQSFNDNYIIGGIIIVLILIVVLLLVSNRKAIYVLILHSKKPR